VLKRVNLSKVSMGRMYFVPEGQLIVARHEYLFSVGFTARRATSAEVSKASRLTLILQANRPDLPAEVSKASYLYSEVFDLKPTSGLYLKNSAHLANFLTPRTVSAIGRIAAEFSAEFYFLLVSGKNVRSAGRQSKTPIRRSRDRTAPGTGAS
jgi:hypothetical protein